MKVNWNTKDFYKSLSDPKIATNKKQITDLTKSFTAKYKGKINSKKITANLLSEALNNYSEITEKLAVLSYFSSFLFTTNTKSEKIKSFYQKTNEFVTSTESQTLWFSLELIELENETANKLIKNPKLNSHKHFLNQLRVMKPFTLSEKEEQIMTLKSQTSGQAFVRLYDQIESTEKFELEIKGKKKTVTSSEIGSIMKSNPDRKLREKAVISYGNTYSKNSSLYTYILNTLILNKKINDEIRGHNFPEEATFLSYEVNKATVESMTKTVNTNKKIVENYYLAKKKIVQETLHEWDRYSDIYNLKSKTYSWNEAKDIVLGCFKDFSPTFYDIAKKFFDNNWIDAEIKDGKRSGAYCSYGTPKTHPMVFVNFSGKAEDVRTLAHELGHAIHATLSRDQNILEFWPSTAVAEIASTFAESLVFEKLYNATTNKKARINLLGGRIQNTFATVFRQNDFYLFESKLHELRRSQGELSETEISNLYQKMLQETFGKGLILTNTHKSFWMPISHFYHYNFYVFTYVFGDLLALSLFAEYKKNKEKFTDNYIKALSAGGSLNPYEITNIMGLNIEDPKFWQKGIELIKGEVDEFQKLTK